ncbi:2-hydroxy-3-oxopropionate reductase [Streptomyces libani subsp. rufus]|nr:2-hydroxy-3-oxopropionate reductase [Streptomyces libani subsp. rufus]
MSTIAFIGLGVMGRPMAGHLVAAGHDVIGFNRSPHRVKELTRNGGRGADSVAEAVATAEVVALMLPDFPDVEQVLEGKDGVFARTPRGALIIDFSTIRPDVTRRLAADAEHRGFRYLDAPVSGGEKGACEATLSIMVGGSTEVFDQARPIFDVLGGTVVHVGGAGAGQTVKAANQLLVAGHIQLLAEALQFLDAHGVDPATAVSVLAGGLAGSKVIDTKAVAMIENSFAPGFRIDLHHKDLGIVTAAAREAGVVIPLGTAVAELMAAARANGDGGLDHSALIRGVRRLNGRPVT